jgi:F-type H+-transporting ATPase subunit delta
MHKDNHHSPVAIAYAEALLELADESKSAAEMGQELRDLRQILDTNPKFSQVLIDPAVSTEERAKLIHTVFDNRGSKLLVSFLGLLNEKGRLALFGAIAGAYDDLLEAEQGNVEVDITTAEKLKPQQLESVRQKVGAALKREAVVHEYTDPSIIGGLILRVQDQLIDGSVRAQLQAMRQHLHAARPT